MNDLKAFEVQATVIRYGKAKGKDRLYHPPCFVIRGCTSSDDARVQAVTILNPTSDRWIGIILDSLRQIP